MYLFLQVFCKGQLSIYRSRPNPGGSINKLNVSGLFGNLIPVTLGNVIGGALVMGLSYWYVYKRGFRKAFDA